MKKATNGQSLLGALALSLAVLFTASPLRSAEPRTVPGLELTLMPIPAGSFDMGSIDGEADERLVTRVTISSDFWLGKTEVTQAQWRAIMGSNPSYFKGDDQRPVEGLPYNDMLAFCRKLTERERAAGRLPDGYAYALPTEAQWEYACRAGTTGKYAGDDLNAMAWYDANSGGQTHPVAQKQANAWGLHDMHGNVWEMCADWYADKLPGGSVRDYTGPPSGSGCTSRGGGCGFSAGDCRSSNRNGGSRTARGGGVGFRLALVPQAGIAQSTGTFTDSRDGQTYKTFSFKNDLTGTTVTWMAQNLNYKVEGSYAYDDKESNRKELGLLYTLEAANKACPNGWHLATDSEWSTLVNKFGGMDKAGEALKSVSGWAEDGNGTNSSGFNALPAGIRRNNRYEVLGLFGHWKTSTPTGEEGKAWGWDMSFANPLKTKVFRFDGSVSNASSVRCVRN